MIKTIEQLRAQAAQIEEAVRQGENTQIRVGGLFMDVIDFIGQIPVTETVLGPLLQALNNSELLDPGDGQTLTFSLMKDGWTFSDALTQLQVRMGQITSTVTSNYEAFLKARDSLQGQIDNTDQRVRSYKTEYDSSQLEYATWKSQTDTTIAQYAVAIDKNTDDIVSISGRVDTAFDQLDFVTNNLDASDKALQKLFNLTGLDYDDPDESYSASWLYKNRQGIYGAAANFDADGNILQASKLQVTVAGIEQSVSNVDGRVASLKIAVDGLTSRVEDAEGNYSSLSQTVAGLESSVGSNEGDLDTLKKNVYGYTDSRGNFHDGILNRIGAAESEIDGYASSASWIEQNRDSIIQTVGRFNEDGSLRNTSGLVTTGEYAGLFAKYMDENGLVTEGNIGVYLKETVDEDGVKKIISEANINADQIRFDTVDWTVTNKYTGDTIFHLDSQGNLSISGSFKGRLEDALEIGKGTRKMYLEPTVTGARLVGVDNDYTILELGFYNHSTYGYIPSLFMHSKNGYNSQDSLIRIMTGSDFAEIVASSAGSTGAYHVVYMTALPRNGYATLGSNMWPLKDSTAYNNMESGEIYVDGDTLKVKNIDYAHA